jgi:hypothetical protein
VLDAAGAIGSEHLERGLGRATITLMDSEGEDDEVEVSVEFSPQLEDLGQGEVAGTPAQLMALEVLETAFSDAEEAQ